MATKETTPRGRGGRRRQTRAAQASDEEHEPIAIARRATRRTSTTVTTLNPSSDAAPTENNSFLENGARSSQTIVRPFFGMGQEPEEKEAKPREEKPTVSERVMAAAAHVGDQVQDTLASAMDSGINWKKLAGLLLLAALISWLTSRIAQPDLTKRQLAAIMTSIEQADQRYSVLMRELEAAQQQVHATEDRLGLTQDKLDSLDKKFQSGSKSGEKDFNGKVDPSVVVGVAEDRMRKLLDVYNADKTGLADFAMHSAGGKVIGHSELAPRGENPTWPVWRRVSAAIVPGSAPYVHPQANKFVLMPGGPIPGECLPLNGSKGYVDIKLRQPIIPTALTYEHVPSSIAYDIRSAPQDLTVTGQLSEAYRFAPKGKGSLLSYLEHRKGLGPTELGTFVYDPSKGSLNTVALDGSIPADEVRIQVKSNYGHPQYTCLYRVRVHGRIPSEEA